MSDKVGVFICTGYGISEALDVEALHRVAVEECGVPFCAAVESCEGAGLARIHEVIAEEHLAKVVVAGISARHVERGAYPDDVVVEHVALREHVVWCQPPNQEDTQMLAEDYLRMYIAKIRKVEPLESFQPEEPIDKTLLVVGGGVVGLTAALEAARAGQNVHVAEKSEKLGGWLARQARSIPLAPPYDELEDTHVDELIAEVRRHPGITVHTSAVTAAIRGAPGLFDVRVEMAANGQPGGEVVAEIRVGAIVQATGWRPTEPRDHVPWGRTADVIRNIELEDMVRELGRITRPSDGAPARRVAFVQGDSLSKSTGNNRLDYSSSLCSLTAMKQAIYLREVDRDAEAYIFYQDMQAPGHSEILYQRVQGDPRIYPIRAEVADVVRSDDGRNTVIYKDGMTGERLRTEVDLVVLAAGMRPNSADGEAVRALEDARVAAAGADTATQREAAEATIARLQDHEDTRILNLEYRQGPDLPALEDEFPDSHFICFPYETRRTGIYAAGSVRQPMYGLASRDDAAGAALKAIQCVEMTGRGEAVHPRAGDRSYPDFFMPRCTLCKRCTEECPFGVLNDDGKGTPLLQVTRCRRCGICMGSCPERIISFKDYSIATVTAMIRAVEVPDELEEKPRFLAFLCENDALPAFELMAQNGLSCNPYVRVIPVRCLGSVNTVWVKEALSAGFDGVVMIGCRSGDDYQCHFIAGSELAERRAENVRETLKTMALENERLQMHELQITEYRMLPEILDKMIDVVDDYGPNPFKGL